MAGDAAAPLDILSGRVVGGEVAAVLGNQVLWAVVLLAVGQVVLRAGRRHLEVQGG
jgi:ABC-2 type transport system permease protein